MSSGENIPYCAAHGEKRVSNDQSGPSAIDIAHFAVLSDKLFSMRTPSDGSFESGKFQWHTIGWIAHIASPYVTNSQLALWRLPSSDAIVPYTATTMEASALAMKTPAKKLNTHHSSIQSQLCLRACVLLASYGSSDDIRDSVRGERKTHEPSSKTEIAPLSPTDGFELAVFSTSFVNPESPS